MSSKRSKLSTPTILVQIVHMEGTRKGQIDEFDADRISIGRDPSCDVVFPRKERIVSRRHAEINREGNRYHLINKSANGCYVNGKMVEEAYLKQGDIIVFAKNGPKVSFLTSSKPLESKHQATPSPRPKSPPLRPGPPSSTAPTTAKSPRAEIGDFTVQFGTIIRSFKEPSIQLGQERTNHFVIAHPRVYNKHAELFYSQGQYFLRDLTQNHQTLVNGRPIVGDSPLQDNDIIQFSDGGPKMRYLGTGRFVEEKDK